MLVTLLAQNIEQLIQTRPTDMPNAIKLLFASSSLSCEADLI